MITLYLLERQQIRFLLSPKAADEERLMNAKPASEKLFSSVPMAKYWGEVELEEKVREELPSDWKLIYGSNRIITFSQTGFDQYGELLSPFGEFLPAHFRGNRVHVFHCTNRLECIDNELNNFESGHLCGPVWNFRRVAFNSDLVESNMMFRTMESLARRLWFTTGSNKADILEMFLDNQTGFDISPVAVLPEK